LTLATPRAHNGPEIARMPYRQLSYRYAIVLRSGRAWPFGEMWESDRLRLLVEPRWRPDADAYETSATVEIVVDLAGVDEDDFEVQLFENALVVEGRRRLPACQEGAVYQTAGIRQGPFRVELPLPALVDPARVEARYDRGLLRISLAKRGAAP
jgi:HSP20 family molecular chaperone IbpA